MWRLEAIVKLRNYSMGQLNHQIPVSGEIQDIFIFKMFLKLSNISVLQQFLVLT